MQGKREEVIQALTQQYIGAGSNNQMVLDRMNAETVVRELYDNRQSEEKLEIIFEVLFAECDDDEDNVLTGNEITQFVKQLSRDDEINIKVD